MYYQFYFRLGLRGVALGKPEAKFLILVRRYGFGYTLGDLA